MKPFLLNYLRQYVKLKQWRADEFTPRMLQLVHKFYFRNSIPASHVLLCLWDLGGFTSLYGTSDLSSSYASSVNASLRIRFSGPSYMLEVKHFQLQCGIKTSKLFMGPYKPAVFVRHCNLHEVISVKTRMKLQ